MKQRLLAQTGDRVSEVGLGCWQLGGADWGHLEDQTAYDILQAAVDNGICFLDTADVYGSGRSETLIGNFMKKCSVPLFVATKLGRLRLYPDKYSRETVRDAVLQSIRRLQVERLDLVQLHCIPVEVLERGEIFGWLEDMKAEGLLRSWGASVENCREAKICLQQSGLASLQVIFNLFRQTPAEQFFNQAKQQGVALIIRLPLASGLLTGKFTRETKFAKEDHRNFNRDGAAFNVGETFSGLPFEKGVELVEELREYVPQGLSLTDLAMRWILDHDAVTTVIPGASRPEQVHGNVRVSDLPSLDPALHRKLAQFYQERVMAHIRGSI